MSFHINAMNSFFAKNSPILAEDVFNSSEIQPCAKRVRSLGSHIEGKNLQTGAIQILIDQLFILATVAQ